MAILMFSKQNGRRSMQVHEEMYGQLPKLLTKNKDARFGSISCDMSNQNPPQNDVPRHQKPIRRGFGTAP